MLTAETRTREATEPSGEPESLWGRMKGKMGDRVQHSKPEGLEQRKAKTKKKCGALCNPLHACPHAARSHALAWHLPLGEEEAPSKHPQGCKLRIRRRDGGPEGELEAPKKRRVRPPALCCTVLTSSKAHAATFNMSCAWQPDMGKSFYGVLLVCAFWD